MIFTVTPSRWAADFSKFLGIAAMTLTLFGVKALFIRYFGSEIPYWDQWDAEADLLYKS
jgi:hypothetical protein